MGAHVLRAGVQHQQQTVGSPGLETPPVAPTSLVCGGGGVPAQIKGLH